MEEVKRADDAGRSSPISIRDLFDYKNFNGIVIFDEVPHERLREPMRHVISNKSFVMAAIRYVFPPNPPSVFYISNAFTDSELPLRTPIIQILNNTKALYNTSTPSAHLALATLSPTSGSSMRTDIPRSRPHTQPYLRPSLRYPMSKQVSVRRALVL
ncbi:hypothetical protein BDQ12DRAFT_139520 [Crucibulum laeve]|uniref:Uncharacterized protein n=1 Tax=Crucibulum laeve TaxID=68775 RepID=A0A5C3M9F8_9AGAR|nr:hypothetical protein BDQ12DRAFT_139520 [Crucibulum laeve]